MPDVVGTPQPSAANIVVCDDDAIYAGMVKETLLSAGYAVYSADDVAHLQQIIALASIDLAIVDFQMPAGGGPAAVKLLRETYETSRAPIIVASGMPVDKQKEWFPDKTRMGFLQKPYPPDALLREIQVLLKPPTAALSPASAPLPEAAPVPDAASLRVKPALRRPGAAPASAVPARTHDAINRAATQTIAEPEREQTNRVMAMLGAGLLAVIDGVRRLFNRE